MFIPSAKIRSYLSQEEIDALPTKMPELSSRCAVCGERGADLHHWAPTGIFGAEAESWPKDYLCPRCHREWHERVTPQLVKKDECPLHPAGDNGGN